MKSFSLSITIAFGRDSVGNSWRKSVVKDIGFLLSVHENNIRKKHDNIKYLFTVFSFLSSDFAVGPNNDANPHQGSY